MKKENCVHDLDDRKKIVYITQETKTICQKFIPFHEEKSHIIHIFFMKSHGILTFFISIFAHHKIRNEGFIELLFLKIVFYSKKKKEKQGKLEEHV